MRKKNHRQIPLTDTGIEHPHAKELERIRQILDENPILSEMVLQYLTKNVKNRDTGAGGMTAEQVLCAAVIKQMEGFSYRELAFHIVDSRSYRKFCRIGLTHKGFKKSALCSNIKALSPETWEAINDILMAYGEDKGIEKGREARIDCTVVSSNIHEPTDSNLLWDCVQVLGRMLCQIKELFGDLDLPITGHRRRAKRRLMGIMNAKNDSTGKELYTDLLKVTARTVGYAKRAVALLKEYRCRSVSQIMLAENLADGLSHYIALSEKVMDQTERRVVHRQCVAASEKIFSIFEPHTDIIVKDRRDPLFGHKVCLNIGSSNLISDCLILEGNPADSTLTVEMLDRHDKVYGRYPLKVALDGGFASQDNVKLAKQRGVKDVCFAKKRGIEVEEMCRSDYVYNRLRRFRAGVESGISWLKRCLGFATCTWKGLRSFKSYVWASIVTANLLTLARRQAVHK
jgi:IS5 family transposase